MIEYPPTPDNQKIDWKVFNKNYYCDELDASHLLDTVLVDHADELIDLRPYMIEHPYQVYTSDFMHKIIEMFRHHHLRHLPVVYPRDGTVAGIITRKDIFTYLPL